ncbi:IclR family transcriptional regulator [Roseateles violae]|uniref:IclR family transcriptional regulator n=1 Tax=Roseateles violae TaxID=3058042 RepID=A0ABT8DUR2_9BURK|nr:IclR family transcriptional regulator [Pelomonas sp. PFR6]MDN3920788.1 IclR family transcriptional regulator [Pelomonas sp. PFR6]
MEEEQERGPRGIQSIEVGGQLLLALAHQGRPLALKDLARAAEMPPAKAHPYLVSFIKLGLVEQEAASGRYGLGPLALQLGLISLQQYEPVRLATPRIEELAAELGHTMAIAVWGNRGPTIVRVAEAPSPVHISMRHGTVMSLRGTASGRLFAAYLPADVVAAAFAAEAALDPAALPRDAELDAWLAEVRRTGIASARDGAVVGVSAWAAPVFDDRGRIVLSLTAIGPSGSFDLDPTGQMATALRRAGEDLSRQLGWRQD